MPEYTSVLEHWLSSLGLFEFTAIQFGMDQMLESSSDQLSTFIHWYYWSLNVGQLVIGCWSTAGVCLCWSMSAGSIQEIPQHCIDRTGQHPLKLVYQVLRYAWNHTCPENCSAFTYWEDDIPFRIDLGKPRSMEDHSPLRRWRTPRHFCALSCSSCHYWGSLLGFHLSGHGFL